MTLKYTDFFALVLLVPMALLGSAKNSGAVTFTETVTVGGTQVPPGTYHVQWQGTGASVQASILQGKNVVASAPATLVNQKTNYDGAVELKKGQDNSTILQAIDWTNRSLRFDQGNVSPPDSSSGTTAD
jgi:hypothetical protein